MRLVLEPGPFRIAARTELQNRHTMALAPKPVIISEICPEVRPYTRVAPRVQSEMMGILMGKCCFTSILQSQEDLVERVSGKPRAARPWPHRRAARTISIDVVTKRISHEEVDHSRR